MPQSTARRGDCATETNGKAKLPGRNLRRIRKLQKIQAPAKTSRPVVTKNRPTSILCIIIRVQTPNTTMLHSRKSITYRLVTFRFQLWELRYLPSIPSIRKKYPSQKTKSSETSAFLSGKLSRWRKGREKPTPTLCIFIQRQKEIRHPTKVCQIKLRARNRPHWIRFWICWRIHTRISDWREIEEGHASNAIIHSIQHSIHSTLRNFQRVIVQLSILHRGRAQID
mmetsp:Transcript_8430/g.17500  ORF Transcript_8430/g.17500 Transcript_8430/m.17500 type:complete len:225 (-) Transcript_8430:763-1437(-)